MELNLDGRFVVARSLNAFGVQESVAVCCEFDVKLLSKRNAYLVLDGIYVNGLSRCCNCHGSGGDANDGDDGSE